MICEKCNANMNYFTEGSSCGWTCPDCGWEIVTSLEEPWDNDLTSYILSVVVKDKPTINDIKTISKIGNINSLKAKELLTNGGVLIEDYASEIIQAMRVLSENSIQYSITPEFPYL